MELDSSGTAVGSLSNQKFLGDQPPVYTRLLFLLMQDMPGGEVWV